MGIKINSFGGPLVWLLRKHYSNLTSKIMLTVAAKHYDKWIRRYIAWFLSQKEVPIFQNVMIETVNRCNGSCSFCPANKKAENRPFKKMDGKQFAHIVDQLSELGWQGKVFLNVNNEPFIDKRILDFAKYSKDMLPNCKIAMISNGTLIDTEKLDAMVGVVDQMIINDYSESYRLSDRHRSIYDYVKSHKLRFASIHIVINRRYSKEILATRAGNAPNKPKKNNKVHTPCIYPFTDLIIFPDGQVGLCCNDCTESTYFGNALKDSLTDIWNSKKFAIVRKALSKGRDRWKFCEECDVVDAGEREQFVKNFLGGGHWEVKRKAVDERCCLRHEDFIRTMQKYPVQFAQATCPGYFCIVPYEI